MPFLTRILVPVVFSERCELAALYAAALASRFQSELTLLHIFVPPWVTVASPEGYAIPPQVEMEAVRARTQSQLDQFLSDELRDLHVQREVLEGDPAQVIAEQARSRHFDLIVMPTHGYGPFRRFLLGSVTAKVLHDAGCPVLTGPHLEHPLATAAADFRKILCAVDLGPQSHAVLEWASRFVAEFHSEVTLLHVLVGAATRLDGIYFDPQWRNDMAEAARLQISSLQYEMRTQHHVRIDAGDVPHVARQAAEETGADLLIIGRGHTHGLLGRLRTNAYAILRESPCPVLAI
ncbi:MAG TPA: universal stress protein, partial [Bryobacteraceae bacterium]|nr:universal stress protein [Bryobacteraceae bacterium]